MCATDVSLLTSSTQCRRTRTRALIAKWARNFELVCLILVGRYTVGCLYGVYAENIAVILGEDMVYEILNVYGSSHRS